MIPLTAGKNVGEKRDADETAEEKRQRKALLKQQKKVGGREPGEGKGSEVK